MSMNQVPTLILGIGGVGCKIAATISDSLSMEDRKYVSIIGIDTNVNDLSLLKEKHRMEIIQTSDDQDVNAYLQKHPDYCDWFPDNNFLRSRTMTDGAGQIRTLSRLACLAAVENGRFDPILSEITRIRKVDSNPHNMNLTVTIVGSITGGTGAGLFLQMPFFIRDLVKTQAGISKCVIRGFFVGPDVLEDVQPSDINKDAVCVNGYSCLKELNAFYMRPVLGASVSNNLRLDFYDDKNTSVDNIPYNYLYLIEKSGKMGTVGSAQLDEMINYISHAVFTLLFSPVTAGALSIEDNFILSLIGAAGMNRYAGVGMCKMVYPVATAQQYVAMTVVRDLVQKEWLLLDRSFKALSKAALSKQKSNGRMELPKIETSYVDLFREATLSEHATLGHLLPDAFLEKEGTYISKAAEFVQTLDTMVEDLVTSDAVREKEEACKVNDEEMKYLSKAGTHINAVWEAMRQYVKYAKSQIASKPGAFADDLFPASWDVMEFQKDKPECIYQLLSTVHPVAARFLIYDLINCLEEKIKELKVEVSGVNLSAYTEQDFNAHKTGNQDPFDTLTEIKDKRDNNPLWKLLGPIGNIISSEESVLRRLKLKLREVSDLHIQTTRSYMENSIKLSVAQLLLERIKQLSVNYKIFFDTVAAKIEKNTENIARLENLSFPYGQEGIYCSKTAFRQMSAEFFMNNPQALSAETKKAIFEQIYLVQSKAFSLTNVAETPAQKEQRIQASKDQLEQVFERAVFDTVLANVIENGGGIVNLSAREALYKEFEMKNTLRPDDPSYNTEAMQFIQEKVSTTMKVASPMLTTETKPSKAELIFLALSPRCSQTDANLLPSPINTSNFYLKTTGPHSTVIINDEFKDTEITCLRLSYNYTIEDLTKYKDGTRNANAYQTRITNLGLDSSTLSAEDLVVVINPHLNCYWHEEGFVPAIHSKQIKEDHLNHLKTFVYAMGLDCFKLINDDEHPDEEGNPRPTWFSYTNGYTQIQPVKKCRQLIGNNYSDVFDAILYNGILKKAILRDAHSMIKNIKGYKTSEELFETILENKFIADLIQTEEEKLQENDLNILDIFLKMRSTMPENAWNELFYGLQLTIWEFCEILFDKNEVLINKAASRILAAIYQNCTVAKKAPSERNFSENMLQTQFEILTKTRYKVKNTN